MIGDDARDPVTEGIAPGISAMDALLEVSFTADCIVCDRPIIDHTWRHPMTMLDHYLTQVLFRGR